MQLRAILARISVWAEFKIVKQLEIRWPSGARQVLKDLPADQFHQVVEP